MALPSLIRFVPGEEADANDVNSNFDIIAAKFTTGFTDGDIAELAGIQGSKLAAASILETKLANNAVSARVLASNAVSGLRAVGSLHIQDGAVLGAAIAAGEVGTGHVAEASLGRSKLKFGTVTGPSASAYTYYTIFGITTWNLGLSAATTQILGCYMNGNFTGWSGSSDPPIYFFAIESGLWVLRFRAYNSFSVAANGWVVTYLTIS
jgi:hypothetical protein